MFGLSSYKNCQSREFFALPVDFKKRFAVRNATENQGFSPAWKDMDPENQQRSDRDHKESYEHRRYANPLCPASEQLSELGSGIADFKRTMDQFYQECFALSKEVLKCLALALNLPGGEDYFEPMMNDADPQLRLSYYPPVSTSIITSAGASKQQEKDGRISEHTDYGLCTLLFQDGIGGLEVDPFHTGEYIPAHPKAGTVLINIGDLLHFLLNGRVKSTIHRVVAPPIPLESAPMKKELLPARFSVPFFVHPAPNTTLDPILLTGQEQDNYRGINAGEWRSWRLAKAYGMAEEEKHFLDKMGVGKEVTAAAI